MIDRLLRALIALHAERRGQAMTEYILVITVLLMALTMVLLATKYALFGYYGQYVFWSNLPFP